MTATRSRPVCYTPTFSGGKAGNRYGGTAARAAPDAARDAHRGVRDPAARARRAGADPGQPAERPARARPGIGADAGQGAGPAAAGAAGRADAARPLRAGRQARARTSRAACPPAPATDGLWCNVSLIAHQGTSGGFKALRYVDPAGHECAFYDTALLFPLNAVNLNSQGIGVAVLDMSDPAHPEQTDTLTELPMLSPHESLNLNTARGAARRGQRQPGHLPGPGLDLRRCTRTAATRCCSSTELLARFGHESGFSPDGKTFYATGTATQSITAIDVSDPKDPHVALAGQRPLPRHDAQRRRQPRLHRRPVGRRHADPRHVSEIQARKPDPQVREVSRLTWSPASIPQNAIPFTRGRPSVRARVRRVQRRPRWARAAPTRSAPARIIDIADETHPRVVSEPAPAGQPARRPQGRGRRPGRDEPGRRATRRTTATSRRASTRRSSPARSSPPGCACSTSATSCTRRRSAYFVAPTTGQGRERRAGQRLRDVAAGVRARAPRGLVHRRRRAGSTCCASPTTRGREARLRLRRRAPGRDCAPHTSPCPAAPTSARSRRSSGASACARRATAAR